MKKSAPKVSVIIPVYNVEPYLRQCLDSVVNQTLKDIEIICVDDKSTDASLSILKEYAVKDDRFVILEQETNQGQGVARNKGIETAHGEYLGFVDSDDQISDNFFEALYNTAKKYHADIACGGIKAVKNEIITPSHTITSVKIADDIDEKLSLGAIPYNCYVWNKIYNREKYLAAGIKFEKMLYEDILWTHKAFCSLGRMVTVTGCDYCYLDRSDSSVHDQSEQAQTDYRKALYTAMRFCYEKNFPLKYLKQYIENYHLCEKSRRLTVFRFQNKNFCWLDGKPVGYMSFFSILRYTDFLQKIFSVKNSGIHKIVTVFGLKMKFKSRRLTEREQFRELNQKLDALCWKIDSLSRGK